MWHNVRLWIRTRFPIKHPLTATINVVWVTHTLVAPRDAMMSIHLLDKTIVSSVNTEIRHNVYVVNLAFLGRRLDHHINKSKFILKDAPPSLSLSQNVTFVFPNILDLSTKLVTPTHNGKLYHDIQGDTINRERKNLPAYSNTPEKKAKRKGSWRDYYLKEDNNKHRRTSKRKQSDRTLDVFDLLLPYLHPPVEKLLANINLFPRERRPYRYQIDGIRFLVERQGALLGDEMGLGKTIQAIVALQVLFRRGKIRRVLILCRRTLLSVWETELKKWAPELYVLKVRGTRHERSRLWRLPSSIYITTYETLREDINRIAGLSNKFDVIILDEVQEIKNPNAKKSRAVRRINAAYRWGLSGTPLENSLEDVISIFNYLQPAAFKGTFAPSSSMAFGPSELPAHTWSPSPESVRRRIQPYFLRRRTKDVLKDLPEKIVNEIWIELTPRQRLAYEKEFEKARDALQSPTVTRVHVFQRINRLKQICNIDPISGESCKVNFLSEQLENIINSQQKALVFSHFPNVTLRQVQQKLSRFDVAILDGSLSDKARERLVRAFQEENSPKVLLMSVMVGGVGLTLTRANHVFHFDHWWNPAIAKQAEGRAHRIGQRQTVFVYDIYTRNTIEERIYNLLKQKQELFDEVIDNLSVPGVQSLIRDEELFALFDLEPPAHLHSRRR